MQIVVISDNTTFPPGLTRIIFTKRHKSDFRIEILTLDSMTMMSLQRLMGGLWGNLSQLVINKYSLILMSDLYL